MISEEEALESRMGPYPVIVVPHTSITAGDGTKLAARIWFPEIKNNQDYFPDEDWSLLYTPQARDSQESKSPGEEYPTILEYLPYRKSDITAQRDFMRHTWFSSHGYVCVRVDMRGTGDSEGLYFDEYTETELEDACEVIKWIADQRWSNERVGMYGKSWGGFNGLQVAYLQPPALKAVVSLYSTDDRYLTDMHYDNGCILGHGMLSWASYMYALNACPPNPLYFSNWKDIWLERLKKSCDPWVLQWLSHQVQDDYWNHGSIKMDYSNVQCPVLAIGGWKDAYHDTVFRLVQNLPVVRGIVGPWAHDWPDIGNPGPQMEYLGECLKWWDNHLKGISNRAMDTPKMRVYLKKSVEPDRFIQNQPGEWAAIEGWPPKAKKEHIFVPGRLDSNNGKLLRQCDGLDTDTEWSSVIYSTNSGMSCAEWLSFGLADGPADQSSEQPYALNWFTDALVEDMPILGSGNLKTKIKIDEGNSANMIVRLCDVHPNGKCTLIALGVLNLTHYNGHSTHDIQPLVPGREYDVNISLHFTGYIVPKEHKLSLSISSGYWPFIWPAPNATPIHILTGREKTDYTLESGSYATILSLPIVEDLDGVVPNEDVLQGLTPQTCTHGPNKPMEWLRPAQTDVQEMNTDEHRRVRITHTDGGRYRLKRYNILVDRDSHDTYMIENDDPLSATAKSEHRLQMELPLPTGAKVTTSISTKSEMWADCDLFHIKNEIVILFNDEIFYEDQRKDQIKRLLV